MASDILFGTGVSTSTYPFKSSNGIEKTGFGEIRITDWETFRQAAGLNNLDMNDP